MKILYEYRATVILDMVSGKSIKCEERQKPTFYDGWPRPPTKFKPIYYIAGERIYINFDNIESKQYTTKKRKVYYENW